MSEITRILDALDQGDTRAADELLPLVYEELRRLATLKLAQEKPGQTLQATALVHETYLRLVGSEYQQWGSRGHFFAAAAEAMRRILVDIARKKRALRMGGGAQRQSLEGIQVCSVEPSEDLLALDEALDRLEQQDKDKAKLVKLRYFTGLTIPQAAKAMGVSVATANRYWAYARAWLHEELQSGGDTTGH